MLIRYEYYRVKHSPSDLDWKAKISQFELGMKVIKILVLSSIQYIVCFWQTLKTVLCVCVCGGGGVFRLHQYVYIDSMTVPSPCTGVSDRRGGGVGGGGV